MKLQRTFQCGVQTTYAALLGFAGALVQGGLAAEPTKAPVPKSPYIAVVYRFADTMLEHGRDTYGSQKTGVFLSALNRHAPEMLTNRPAAPAGRSFPTGRSIRSRRRADRSIRKARAMSVVPPRPTTASTAAGERSLRLRRATARPSCAASALRASRPGPPTRAAAETAADDRAARYSRGLADAIGKPGEIVGPVLRQRERDRHA